MCFLCRRPELLKRVGISADLSRLTVAGDSVGGNMATVMTILSQNRRGPAIQKQLLYYPVTNAAFDTESYCRFAEGYYLYREGMMWFWDQYAPSEEARRQITASPLCAAEQLKGTARCDDHQRRGRCSARRGRGLCRKAERGGRRGYSAARPGNHPRFCHAQRPRLHCGLPRGDGRIHRLDQPQERMPLISCALPAALPEAWRFRPEDRAPLHGRCAAGHPLSAARP